MIPDLGKYAFEVSLAYAVSLTILFVLILRTLMRSARVRRALEQQENRKSDNG